MGSLPGIHIVGLVVCGATLCTVRVIHPVLRNPQRSCSARVADVTARLASGPFRQDHDGILLSPVIAAIMSFECVKHMQEARFIGRLIPPVKSGQQGAVRSAKAPVNNARGHGVSSGVYAAIAEGASSVSHDLNSSPAVACASTSAPV